MSGSRDDGSLIKSCDENAKIFVGGLSWDTDEEKLRKYFEKFGNVRDCTIKRDNSTMRSRGFGFILFADPSSVDKALESSITHILDGRNIDPKRAKALKKDHKLFVGGLNPDTKEEIIKDYFQKFGEIDSFERPNDKMTNKPRGFCFISFVKDGVVNEIITQSKYHTIDGRQCECKDGDPKKQTAKGNSQFSNPNQYPPQTPWMPPSMYQGYQQMNPYGYDVSSGYGGYGSAYGNPGGMASYGAYAGMYPGYAGYAGEGYGQQMAPSQQNSGGKAKTGGRGGQNNYKPY